MTLIAPALQGFFTDRLIGQRNASPHTVAAYRDTFRLLLSFASHHAGKPASQLDLDDLGPTVIAAFLDHLEVERGNSVATRNARLAAIHSLFRYAALHHPDHAATIQQVLAIPPKRCERTIVTFLTEPEIDAFLAAPNRGTWTGRRDYALLVLTVQTGLRVSRKVTVPVSAGLLADTEAYFDTLTQYREGEIAPIVETMANASFRAIDNGRRLVDELRGIRQGWNDTVKARRDSTAWKLADLLMRQPVVDASVVVDEVGVRDANALRPINTLVDAGVLTEFTGFRRNRMWQSREVIAALDEFAARAGRRG